jgi:hypothetical protein
MISRQPLLSSHSPIPLFILSNETGIQSVKANKLYDTCPRRSSFLADKAERRNRQGRARQRKVILSGRESVASGVCTVEGTEICLQRDFTWYALLDMNGISLFSCEDIRAWSGIYALLAAGTRRVM